MMTVLVIGIILLALFGAPIFACMGALAVVGATTLVSNVDQSLAQQFAGELIRVKDLITGDAASKLATIPLFTFAGYIMAEAKTAQRLVTLAQALVGWIPGGLGVVTILVCALFTTFTGASGVTIVAVGGLILPALLKEGYKRRFGLGLITGTGSIGLLFPPALPLFVYGIVYGLCAHDFNKTRVGDSLLEQPAFTLERFLFAGIVPGLVLCGIFGTYVVMTAVRQRVPRTQLDLRAASRALLPALPELALPVWILLALSKGWLQIPEMAAFAALYVLLLETLGYRDIKLRDLPRITREAMVLVGAIYLVIVASTALTDYFVNARIPDRLYDWVDDHIQSKWTFLFMLNVLLLIVGCLMDVFTAIVAVVPLIARVAYEYGVDPYHLGVIFLLNLEIGYLTPPVGLNLFITGLRFRMPIADVVRASLPFLGLMVVALGLVTYVPQITPVRVKGKYGVESEEPIPTQAADAGPEIVWPDGGVWAPSKCATFADPADTKKCEDQFRFWAECNRIENKSDQILCQDEARKGNPYPDAGPDE